MISGLGAHSPQRPTYAGRPLPGIQPVLLDGDGNEITGDGVERLLVCEAPMAVYATYDLWRPRAL